MLSPKNVVVCMPMLLLLSLASSERRGRGRGRGRGCRERQQRCHLYFARTYRYLRITLLKRSFGYPPLTLFERSGRPRTLNLEGLLSVTNLRNRRRGFVH